MKNKFIILTIAGLLLVSLAACRNEKTSNADQNTFNTTADNQSRDLTFEDLSHYAFQFCSGAGGWSTDFEIEKDGSFKGNYHDSDMGDTGENYENGNALYYLAQAYRKNEDMENAKIYYQKVVELYPNTERAANAQNYLDQSETDTAH
jgi:tetratricopeptide (TPR) repeat protein